MVVSKYFQDMTQIVKKTGERVQSGIIIYMLSKCQQSECGTYNNEFHSILQVDVLAFIWCIPYDNQKLEWFHRRDDASIPLHYSRRNQHEMRHQGITPDTVWLISWFGVNFVLVTMFCYTGDIRSKKMMPYK